MQIETIGSGPPLVLVHGWALHGGVFGALAERLSDRFTLYVVDLPGHGGSRDSAVPLALQACVDAICDATPPAAWLGWSLGGLFALKAAAVSGQVRALAMVSSVPRFSTAPDWPQAVDPAVFAQFGVALQQDYRGTLERFIALDTLGTQQGRAELQALRQMLYARGEPTAAALQAGLGLLERSDLRHTLPGLDVPSLWIAGTRDRLVHPRGMEAAAALTPQSAFLEIAGGGHAPFLGHLDQVEAALVPFLDKAFRAS
ncbi:pimeloyl-ACP methyl ester esterase BioH [Pseudoxanthomonas sp.]|uniref:pimeloyl-ACP methyl ester esterase BioH n=1 Tax=Pseudoxanthomonas sp. TaxID=1871049 RepID=UPI002633EE2A|nr:pimeloyl-ACP methyl ester esterase BioH [Pseudoxanthomonas sp.]WDS38142.1 MAG: pimeloyl-ACP methyl ester esterase BioH [Pseudoxanthomonas sp.]